MWYSAVYVAPELPCLIQNLQQPEAEPIGPEKEETDAKDKAIQDKSNDQRCNRYTCQMAVESGQGTDGQLQPPRLNWALRNAVNDTAKQIERQAEREMAKAASIPGKRVEAGIYIRPMATADLLEATVRGSKSPILLKIFKAKETLAGVTVRIWGKKQVLPHAFIRSGKFPDRKDLGMGGIYLPASAKIEVLFARCPVLQLPKQWL